VWVSGTSLSTWTQETPVSFKLDTLNIEKMSVDDTAFMTVISQILSTD